MSPILYYAQMDGEYFGPFSLDTIYNMHLTPDILVMASNTNLWQPASSYPELAASLDLETYDYTSSFTSPPLSNAQHSVNKQVAPIFNERSIFYIRRGGSPYGPYTLEALASVTISDDTEVSLDGMTSWFRAGDITGLLTTLESIARFGETMIQSQSAENDEGISSLLDRLQKYNPSDSQPYRRVFPSAEAELDFIVSEYCETFNEMLEIINALSKACQLATLNRRAVAMISSTVNNVTRCVNDHYMAELRQLSSLQQAFTTASISIGKTYFSLPAPLKDVDFYRINFLNVLGEKNLYVTYDASSIARAEDFVNSILGRLYKSNPARMIVAEVIDTEGMTGLADTFKLINRDLYHLVIRPDEVRTLLNSLQDRAGSVLRNLLTEPGMTLQDYNSTHDSKEANILFVIKNFPRGMSPDALSALKRLSKVGPKAGIYTILMSSVSEIEEMSAKEIELFDVMDFAKTSNSFHFSNNSDSLESVLESTDSDDIIEGITQFGTLTDAELKEIIHSVNAKCELRDDVAIPFLENMPSKSQWWTSKSSKLIEVPFGMGDDMLVKSLRITQESGQNTVVVIGIPGSGKSVFLHSLICSAAIKYSPDELRMYLIDFSGVEFNTYAIGQLPHARVIAPEAEREFGLSILRELVEEGSRRMALCRDHNVSNIVDLKKVAPDIKVPRLLVIIDEFQKLFEIENDLISREANTKIHIVIQEFRKFGINLVLATQKLPNSQFLPRDLIANRVVFKSAPNDFNTLITMEDKGGIPRLRTGQCIYNSESGTPYGNEKVQGFFVSRVDIEQLLDDMESFEKTQTYEHEQIKVFRSDEQPEFVRRRVHDYHRGFRAAGQSIPVYVGESVSVSDHDVCLEFSHEGGNNLLIIGGESAVAEAIAYHSVLSVSMVHDSDDATIIVVNGMRADNIVGNQMIETIQSLPFKVMSPSKIEDIEQVLTSVKETIDERRASGDTNYSNIYLTIFEAQNCRAFDQVSNGRSERASQSATLLDYIVKSGPAVGVFTILQVANLAGLTRIGTSMLSNFNHRIALQMTDRESTSVMNDESASKLFIFNRPSSVFRAYLYDKVRNTSIKFKPYKS